MGLNAVAPAPLGRPSIGRGGWDGSRGYIYIYIYISLAHHLSPARTQVYGGKLYVFAGTCCQEYCSGQCTAESKVQIYDVAANKWTMGQVMSQSHHPMLLASSARCPLLVCSPQLVCIYKPTAASFPMNHFLMLVASSTADSLGCDWIRCVGVDQRQHLCVWRALE